MGDRTYVNLYVLNTQAEAAKELFGRTTASDETTGETLSFFGFQEVNYGELSFLDELQQAGIAYDSNWDSGDDYNPGTKSLRFTPEGEIHTNVIYDGESSTPLEDLLPLIDKPIELRQYILDRQKRFEVLPWDNQEQYGKVYKTVQLIAPTDAAP